MKDTSYSACDAILEKWAQNHDLHLDTQYQDIEIRAVTINDSIGRAYRIGISPPSTRGEVTVWVAAWDYKKRNTTYTTTIGRLPETLDDAMRTIKNWMIESLS